MPLAIRTHPILGSFYYSFSTAAFTVRVRNFSNSFLLSVPHLNIKFCEV